MKNNKMKVKPVSSLKLNMMDSVLQLDDDKLIRGSIEGVIVGANIKPLCSSSVCIKNCTGDAIIERWAIFIHIKLPDNKQLDMAWELNDTISFESGLINTTKYVDTRNIFSTNKGKRIPVLKLVLNACGVKEWVELIGTHVLIDMIQHSPFDPFGGPYNVLPSVKPISGDRVGYMSNWSLLLDQDEIWERDC